jgi:cytochrome P450
MHPCQFLAFGLGPRACLGAHFANYEAKLLLTEVITQYRVEMSADTEDPMELIMPTVILNPANNIHLNFTALQ